MACGAQCRPFTSAAWARPLDPQIMITAMLANRLVSQAGIPLILQQAAEPGSARAWTHHETWKLPDNAIQLFGPDHPYQREAAEDLVALCHHPSAGQLVICEWRPGERPVSFPMENGSHIGPGIGEIDAFILAPPDALLPDHTDYLLPAPHRPALRGNAVPVSYNQYHPVKST